MAPPSPSPSSRALPLAIALLLLVVVADLLTGGSVLTIVAVTLLAAVALALTRVTTVLARTARDRTTERDAERLARRRADLLARSGELLESSLDPDTMLSRIAALAVPDHAELAIVDLLQADGMLRGAIASGADPELAESLSAVRARFPLDVSGEHPVAVALRTGRPQVLPELTEEELARYAASEEHFALIRRSAYRSALVLPLIARGRTLGALSLLRLRGGEPFDEDDVTLGRDLARRAALGLDNARLHTELRRAEGQLEAIVENLGEAVAAIGADGTLRFANAAAAELAGAASPAALVRAGSAALLARWRVADESGAAVAPEDFLHRRALAGETPEARLRHVVDRETGRDRWLLTRVAPVLHADGAVDFVVWVGEDMTAVKRQELRERLLSNASKLLGSSLDVEATLDKAAWAVVPELADWARVDLADERGALESVAVAHRELEKVELLEEWRREFPPAVGDTRGPAEVLRTGRSVVWSSVGDDDVARYAQAPRHAELMRAIATRSLVIVPLVVGERVIGTMQLATTVESGRLLGEDELEVAEELARRAAIAVEHARVHAARTHIATTLQRSLLPPRLPVIPGLTIAARFRAAGGDEVGGDFYDLFERRGGKWLVLMGDVTGKGPGAAAITSLARYTMRTVAQYEDDPRAMLGRLNATLGADADRRQICTAVCVGVGDVGVEGAVSLSVVCAGHPSPLLVSSVDGGMVRAVGRSGTLLGAFPNGAWTTTDVVLNPGDSLVLYTDGVTDVRRDDGVRFGTERLAETLRALGPLSAEELASGIDAALLEYGEQRDDVAILVLTGAAAGGTTTVVGAAAGA